MAAGNPHIPGSPYPRTPVNSVSKYPYYFTSDLTESAGLVFSVPAKNQVEAERLFLKATGRTPMPGTLAPYRKSFSGWYPAMKMLKKLPADTRYVDIHADGEEFYLTLRDTGQKFRNLKQLSDAIWEEKQFRNLPAEAAAEEQEPDGPEL
jgi:hypothetical protein